MNKDAEKQEIMKQVEELRDQLKAAEIQLDCLKKSSLAKEVLLQKEIKLLNEITHEKEFLLHELHETQNQMVQNEKNAALGTLTAGICHEINNLLTPVFGHASLLEMENLSAKGIKSLKVINECLDGTVAVMQSLLVFSSRAKTEKDWHAPGEILRDVVALSGYTPKARNTNIVLEVAENLPEVYANKSQLSQVVFNLLSNALDATSGRDDAKVTVAAEVENNEIVIKVIDNGIGIPREKRTQIFDPFFTTKEPGAGTGLGLSICFGIINEHKGKMTVNSIEGEGTVFYIYLPLNSRSQP